jgi:hypothetical protein
VRVDTRTSGAGETRTICLSGKFGRVPNILGGAIRQFKTETGRMSEFATMRPLCAPVEEAVSWPGLSYGIDVEVYVAPAIM